MNAQIRSHSLQPLQMAAQAATSVQAESLTYTVTQAAAKIGISKPSVYRLLKRRILKAVPGLRHKRIPCRQVHDFVNGDRHD